MLIKSLFLAWKSCGHVQRLSRYSAAACLPNPGTPEGGTVLSGIWGDHLRSRWLTFWVRPEVNADGYQSGALLSFPLAREHAINETYGEGY